MRWLTVLFFLSAAACQAEEQTPSQFAAACDFTTARIADADNVWRQRHLEKHELKFAATAEYPAIYTFRDRHMSFDYFLKDGEPTWLRARMPGEILLPGNQSKRDVLRHLDVDPSQVGASYSIGCDMTDLDIEFNGERVKQIIIRAMLD